MPCDVTGTQGSGIPAGIGADSGKFRLWTGIPGIRDCRLCTRRGVPLGRYSGFSHEYSAPKKIGTCPQWWDIPSFIQERMGFIPGWEVQQKYG